MVVIILNMPMPPTELLTRETKFTYRHVSKKYIQETIPKKFFVYFAQVF